MEILGWIRHQPPPAASNLPGGAPWPWWCLLVDDLAPRTIAEVGQPPEPLRRFAATIRDAGAAAADPDTAALVVTDLLPRPLVWPGAVVAGRGHADVQLIPGGGGAVGRSLAVPRTRRRATLPQLAVAAGRPPARRVAGVVAAHRDRVGTLPSYLRTAAEAVGTTVDPTAWQVVPPRGYGSQKATVLAAREGGGRVALRVVHDPRFDGRLAHEFEVLTALHRAGAAPAGSYPAPIGATRHAERTVTVSVAVDGIPYTRAVRRRDHPAVDAVVGWLTALGRATRRTVPGSVVARAVADLVDRLLARYRPGVGLRTFLEAQLERLATSRLPVVLLHGDVGPQNLLRTEDGVAVLDWENAEAAGPPLWDLLHYLRSHAAHTAGRLRRRRDPFAVTFLEPGPPARWAARQLARYVDAVGVPAEAVAPLFHLCWVYHAVRELWRLPAGSVGPGWRRVEACAAAGDAAAVLRGGG